MATIWDPKSQVVGTMQYVAAYIALLREAYEDIIETASEGGSHGFIIASSVLIPFFCSLFFITILVHAAPYTPPTPTASMHASQLGTSTIVISLIDSEMPLNAAEVELYFDPLSFTVTDLLITDSLCDPRFVMTKEIDNTDGRVFYQCGTLTPFTGSSTVLAILSVKAQTLSTSTLHFGTQTNTLAHDGYGSYTLKERVSSAWSL